MIPAGAPVLVCARLAYYRSMKTPAHPNPRLQSAKAREQALYISVKSSSAIEGIHAPFAKARWAKRHKDMDSLIAYWKRQSRR
jgi:hypothetical protein